MKRLLLLLTLAIFFLGAPHAARCAVIYSGVQNIPIPTTFDGVYLDIDNGNTGTSAITGWDINVFFGGVGIGGSAAFQPARIGTGSMDTILRYSLYDWIDGSLLYAGAQETGSSDHLGAPGNFQNGVQGYLGFKFTKNDNSGPFYGWMSLTLTANTPGGVIHDWAWDDSGAAIQIPEPGRALLLLLGMSALQMRRRRSAR